MSGTNVLVAGGSLRKKSISEDIMNTVKVRCESLGASANAYPMREIGFGVFDPEFDYKLNDEVQAFLQASLAARSVVWCVPAYHGGVSGAFKNAIDYYDLLRNRQKPFLAGKTVFVITVGAGVIAPVATARMLVDIAHALRASVYPNVLPVQVGIDEDAETWQDGPYRDRISEIATMAAALALR